VQDSTEGENSFATTANSFNSDEIKMPENHGPNITIDEKDKCPFF
jgi:hypothetical protein